MPASFITRLRFAWPLARLGWRYLDDSDSWRSLPHDVPMQSYGSGNFAADFKWYLEGPSGVPVREVNDIGAWLVGCQYERDSTLFGRSDYWQHPTGFEALRRGDCEDHALWAWRKLIELGYPAELVVGGWQHLHDEAEGQHAWVVFKQNDLGFVLESVDKNIETMIQPLAQVRSQYRPHLSIDHQLQGRKPPSLL